MANFNTHITVAATASGLMSTLFLQVGLASQSEALLMALTGTIGGILPDVDLQRSYPSRILFSFIAIVFAFLIVFSFYNLLSIAELWVLGVLSFLLVRFPVWKLFHEHTTHRGSIHSLVTVLVVMFTTSAIAYHWLGYSPFVSWMVAMFMTFGFMIHLILDEIYSVDFSNRRIKRSFGTALKVFDKRKPKKTMALITMAIFAWYVAPDSRAFWDTVFSQQTYQIIAPRLWPEWL